MQDDCIRRVATLFLSEIYCRLVWQQNKVDAIYISQGRPHSYVFDSHCYTFIRKHAGFPGGHPMPQHVWSEIKTQSCKHAPERPWEDCVMWKCMKSQREAIKRNARLRLTKDHSLDRLSAYKELTYMILNWLFETRLTRASVRFLYEYIMDNPTKLEYMTFALTTRLWLESWSLCITWYCTTSW